MKTLDRYVISSFLKNYVISFLVLVGMYVVLDMIFNFDELVEVKGRDSAAGPVAVLRLAWYIADFYFYQSFLFFMHLSGIIPVVAASFTLMRMVRFNELSALLSAGVPLLRVAMPIIVVSLLLNGLLWVDQELLVPNMIPQLIRKHDYAAEKDSRSFQVSAMRDESGDKLFAGRYFPTDRPQRMEGVTIIRQDQRQQPVAQITADQATWDGSKWILKNGLMHVNIAPRHPDQVRTQPIAFYQSSITPEEIQLYRSGDFVDLLSTRRINELLRRPRSYGQQALLRVKHTRGVAQIILNMILLLLAISAVLTRDPQQLRMAATRCVILCGSCLSLAFMGHEMAGWPPAHAQLASQWPALMAWLPIFIWGPIAIYLLDRVRT